MTTKAKVIPLTKGYVAIISDEDYKRVSKHKWHVHFSKGEGRKCGYPYARSNVDGRKVYMHRFIMGVDCKLQPDHKNHLTLDNRRENLEVVDNDENQKRKRVQDKAKKAISLIRKIKRDNQTLSQSTLSCLNRIYEVLK